MKLTEAVRSSTMLRTYQITQCDKSEDRCLNNVGCARLSIVCICCFVSSVAAFFFQTFHNLKNIARNWLKNENLQLWKDRGTGLFLCGAEFTRKNMERIMLCDLYC